MSSRTEPHAGTRALSWAPYGRGAMTASARTVSMSPVMPTRISMAPVQVKRSMAGADGAGITMAPVSIAPVTMSPVPPAPPAPARPVPSAPRTSAPSTRYRSGAPTAGPQSAHVSVVESATSRAAARRTARPTAERTAARGGRPATRGVPMPPPPAPGARPRPGVPSTAGYPRPTPAAQSLPFDPFAIVAIIAAFFYGPLGLLLAITSIGRARKNRVSVALSVVALLVAVAMTTFQFGLGSVLGGLAGVLG